MFSYSIYGICRKSRWDLEVIGSLVNSKAVLKLPLAHPMGLPEKCTCCITDQLTLSAVPHIDWRTLRKLQTFTGADRTRFSPHTRSSTSACLDTFRTCASWSRAGDICEPWLTNSTFLCGHWAGKPKRYLLKRAIVSYEINSDSDIGIIEIWCSFRHPHKNIPCGLNVATL